MKLGANVSSVHTHSILCDGKNTLSEMAAAAYAAGVRYFGASGHSHTPAPEDVGNVLDADLSAYRTEVLRLREEYAGRMEVLIGIEWDSQSDGVRGALDYWIGSVHELYSMKTGEYYCVDWEAESLIACRDGACGGDFLSVAEWYYRDVAALARQKPTILGHIDLITKLNRDGAFFDETAPRYREAALAALHAADPAVTLLEINTGSVQRGYRKTPYPAPFLLKEWRAMGGKVILTSDAHSADAILFGYDMAAEAARAAGFTETAILTMGGLSACPL
jgi:histidinol-phosphatase (PHP family)